MWIFHFEDFSSTVFIYLVRQTSEVSRQKRCYFVACCRNSDVPEQASFTPNAILICVQLSQPLFNVSMLLHSTMLGVVKKHADIQESTPSVHFSRATKNGKTAHKNSAWHAPNYCTASYGGYTYESASTCQRWCTGRMSSLKPISKLQATRRDATQRRDDAERCGFACRTALHPTSGCVISTHFYASATRSRVAISLCVHSLSVITDGRDEVCKTAGNVIVFIVLPLCEVHVFVSRRDVPATKRLMPSLAIHSGDSVADATAMMAMRW